MLTIFTCPKPFIGHINIIQRNAIKSWTLLQPSPQIILIGDDEGTAEISKEFNICHIPEVDRNEFGTPLISSVFSNAEAIGYNPVLCYVNADIILRSDFMYSIQRVLRRYRRFLIVGRRWDVALEKAWNFEQSNWEIELKNYVLRTRYIHSWDAIDYFVFTKGLFHNTSPIPPFALGRTSWDNWLIYRARSIKVPVIDITPVSMVIHQNHDYSHYPGGRIGLWSGEEAKRNIQLAGGHEHIFCIADATHVLTKRGLKSALGPVYLWRRIYTLSSFYPMFIYLRRLIDVILHLTRSLRVKFGLILSGQPDKKQIK